MISFTLWSLHLGSINVWYPEYTAFLLSLSPVPQLSRDIPAWKYELRPAVKTLHQLRPRVSASRVSVAARVVYPKHGELRPAISKELHQLHRKIRVYKMSNNWKVLTQFYCTLLRT